MKQTPGIWTQVTIAAAVSLSGCTTYGGFAGADWPMPYTASAPRPHNGASVAVSVVDQRPYVLSGEKKGTFIGFVRSAAGVPWNTTFEPEEPVAKKVERDIIAEVTARGYEVGPGDRALDVAILEFKHDGYETLTIFHNVEVIVSREGRETTTTVKDMRSLCGGIWARCDDSRKAEDLKDYYRTMIRSIVATLSQSDRADALPFPSAASSRSISCSR